MAIQVESSIRILGLGDDAACGLLVFGNSEFNASALCSFGSFLRKLDLLSPVLTSNYAQKLG